jgi:hypothetical protein
VLNFIKKFRKWFDLVWMHYAKAMKEIENRKRKERKQNKKNREGPRGTPRPRSEK